MQSLSPSFTMSDIISTAVSVLSKTRYAWSIPGSAREHTQHPYVHPILQGNIFMNKKTHSTHDVPSAPPGDYASQHNQTAQDAVTPLNQGRRTPGSRSDRDDHLGSHNQSRQRKNGPAHGG
ncbi:MAG: hypothetical protein EBS37_06670 [Betaproteobacteria bacterium]|nr:hypothetical protein [Betaproteobacteria bacterium]